MAFFGMVRSQSAANVWRVSTQDDLRQASEHAAEDQRTPAQSETTPRQGSFASWDFSRRKGTRMYKDLSHGRK